MSVDVSHTCQIFNRSICILCYFEWPISRQIVTWLLKIFLVPVCHPKIQVPVSIMFALIEGCNMGFMQNSKTHDFCVRFGNIKTLALLS